MDADPGARPSDEELMSRLKAGEGAALAQLMQRWEIPIKRFVFRIVGNAAEAEDLAQEVFLRVFTKRGMYRDGAKFSTWCFSIAANQSKNRLRWWRRRPSVSLDAWSEVGGEVSDESAGGAQASSVAMRREKIASVQAAVAALPVDQRTALVLFEYEGQSMEDIASALGCSAKAVENRLYRARNQLRQALRSP
jgi:RNA polymerase sigma factor (sigma-70 family)